MALPHFGGITAAIKDLSECGKLAQFLRLLPFKSLSFWIKCWRLLKIIGTLTPLRGTIRRQRVTGVLPGIRMTGLDTNYGYLQGGPKAELALGVGMVVVQNGHGGRMAMVLLPVLLRRKPLSVGLLFLLLIATLGWGTGFCFCKEMWLLPRELLTLALQRKVASSCGASMERKGFEFALVSF